MKNYSLLLLLMLCLKMSTAQNPINVSVRFMDDASVPMSVNWMTMCSVQPISIIVHFNSSVTSADSIFLGINLSNAGESIDGSPSTLGNWALFNLGISHAQNDSVQLNLNLNVNCFPQSNTGNPVLFYQDAINLFDGFDTLTVIPDSLWNLDVVGSSGISLNLLAYDLYFPFLVPDVSNDNNFEVDYIDIYNSLHNGDSVARTLSYMSAMSDLPDHGYIDILAGFSDSIGCGNILFKDVYLLNENDSIISSLTNINSTSFHFPISSYAVDYVSKFKFVETFTFPLYETNCLSNLCSNEQRKFNSVFSYGCTDIINGIVDTNLCNSDLTNNYLIIGTKEPVVEVSRLSPDPNLSLGRNWDIDFEQNPTKTFQFVIFNSGNDVAKNVYFKLENLRLNSFFYLPDSSNILISITDTSTHLISHTFLRYVDRDTNALSFPYCVQFGGLNEALVEATAVFDFLFPGDSIFLEFPITYCCPSNDDSTFGYSVFDQEKQLNSCNLVVVSLNDCNVQIPIQSHLDVPNDFYGYSLSENGAHPKQLYLNQSFTPASVDFNSPQNSCSQPLFFTINNTDFWKNQWNTGYNYQILNFLTDTIANDLTTLAAKARFMFEFDFEPGLQLVHNSFSDFRFSNSLRQWHMDSLLVDYDTCMSGAKAKAYYSIDSLEGGNSVQNFLDFMNTSTFSFRVKGCCCGTGISPKMIIKSYLAGRDLDCFIPMCKHEVTASIHCPGCDMAGSTITGQSKILERISYGYKDTDNDGLANFPLERLDTNYISTHPEINLHYSIPGDTLASTIVGVITNDGARTLDSLRNRNIFLKYCYLEQKIPLSNSSRFNLQLLKVDVGYKHNGVSYSTTLLASDPLFDTIVHDVRDSILFGTNKSDMIFYDLSEHALSSLFGIPSLLYNASDTFRIKAYYKECGNFHSGTSILPSDNSFLSLIACNMYLTGVNYAGLGQFNVYTDHLIAVAQETPDSLINNSLLYFCESQGGNHYFQSIYPKTTVSFFDFDAGGTACTKKLMINQTVYMGGNSVNIFPYEFRATPDLTSLQITMPGGNGAYNFLPLDSTNSYSGVRTLFTNNCNVPSYHSSTNNAFTSIAANGIFPVQSVLASEQLDSTDFANSCGSNFFIRSPFIYSGDELANRSFSFDFVWDACGFDSTLYFADTVVKSIFNWNLCGQNASLASEIDGTHSGISVANPKLAHNPVALIHSRTRTQCFDVTIRNSPIGSENISNMFIYLPESPYLENFTINGDTGQYITLPNSSHVYLFDLGNQIQGFDSIFSICGTFTSCSFDSTIHVPVHYGWNCGGYPTPQEIQDRSACFDSRDSLLVYFDFIGIAPTQTISDPVDYRTCFEDTVVFEVINNGAAIDSIQLSYQKNSSTLTVDSVQFFYSDSASNPVQVYPDTTFFSGTTYYFNFYEPQANYTGSLQFSQKLTMRLFFTSSQQITSSPPPLLFDYRFSSYCSSVNSDTIQYAPSTYIALPGGCNALSVIPKSSAELNCYGSAVALSAQILNGHAPYTVIWTSSSGFTSTGVSVVDTPSTSTTYTVQVTDSSGNVTTATILVNVIASPLCCIPTDFDPQADFNFSDTSSLGLGLASISAGNRKILINGTFNVNSNFHFNNCTNIVLGPGAVINVMPGDTLFMYDSFIFACSDMSKGIRVQHDGAVVLVSTTIYDAQYGIETFNHTYVSVEGCTFQRNYIGIYFHGNTGGGNITGQFDISNTRFECPGNLILPYTNQFPVPMTKTFAGIYSDWVNFLPIGTKLTNVNVHFNQLNFGIYAFNSNVTIERTTFQDIKRYDNYPVVNFTLGSAIYADAPAGGYFLTQTGNNNPASPDFVNCYTGIFAIAMNVTASKSIYSNCDDALAIYSGLNKTIRITENTIDCNSSGIWLWNNQGAKSVLVDNNIIHAGLHPFQVKGTASSAAGICVFEGNVFNYQSAIQNNSIYLHDHSQYGLLMNGANHYFVDHNVVYVGNDYQYTKTGIYLRGSNLNSISCNDIIGSRANQSMQLSTEAAMRIESSQSNLINCNAMTRMSYGLRLAGSCRGIPGTSGTVIRANDFGEHYTGLFYSGSADAEKQNLKGNNWFDNGYYHYPGWGAENLNTLNAANDKYYYDEYAIVSANRWNHPDSTLIDPQYWFQHLPFVDENCDNDIKIHRAECMISIGDPGGDELRKMLQIAEDSISSTEFDLENRKNLRIKLYEQLLKMPNYLDSSQILYNFYTYYAGSNIQTLASLNVDKEKMFSSQVSLYSMIENNSLNIYQQTLLIQDLDKKLTSSTYSEAEYDSLKQMRISLEENIKYMITYNLYAMDVFKASLSLSADELLSNNSNLINPEIYDQNDKMINEFYLLFIKNFDFDLLLNNSETIRLIAEQCPLLGGPAVYRARTLYAIIDPDKIYEDELVCLQGGIAYRKKTSTEAKSIIYPNPSQNKITILYSFENAKRILICNSIGEVVKSEKLNDKQSQISLSCLEWGNGLYFYKILDDNGNLLDTQRFIILIP